MSGRILPSVIAAALALLLAAPALAAPTAKHPPHKHRATTARSVPGYGFLPGVRTPRQIERDNARAYYAARGPRWYGPASYVSWPGFYRGRWNGGGFGPCYTQTPIGYMWNCGR
jgi:hypothetical protein